ncbi:MAG: ABC transporter permease [Chloroflexota bacterium]|nr:ABC transporter permease [Chloroflexota bacterium]
MAVAAPPVPWAEEVVLEEKPVSTWGMAGRRLLRHRLAVLGIAVLVFFVAISLLAPVIAPYDPDAIDLSNMFGAPSEVHLLGTDPLGRDILTRLMFAGRISLTIAMIGAILSTIVGVVIGAVAGYFGGWIDTLLMRFTDVMLTLPVLPLLLIASQSLRQFVQLQQLFGDILSVVIIIFVVVMFGWMTVTRLLYGSVLSLKNSEFMEAARALGASPLRMIGTHLVPNSMAPIIVATTLDFGAIVVYEATLSFLGFGVTPPTPSWGTMLTDVQRFIIRDPLLAIYPGMCIFLTVLAINFIGDGLRDALDPRLKI